MAAWAPTRRTLDHSNVGKATGSLRLVRPLTDQSSSGGRVLLPKAAGRGAPKSEVARYLIAPSEIWTTTFFGEARNGMNGGRSNGPCKYFCTCY